MMLQRLNAMRKKLIKIQIANYVTGIITSIIWSVLFYYACLNTGNSRDFINMFFPAWLFVISVVGFLIIRIKGIKYFYLSLSQPIVSFLVVSLLFRGIGQQKAFYDMYSIFVSFLAVELLFFVVLFQLPVVLRTRHINEIKETKSDEKK